MPAGKMLRSLIRILMTFAIAPAVFGQNQPGFEDKLAPRKLYIDYVSFRDDVSDSVVVDVFYKAYSSALSYEKWSEKFKASYEIDIVINKKGKQVTGASRDGDLFADSYEMTRSPDDFIIDKFTFKLFPDNYELIGRLVDTNSGDELSVKEDIKLKDFDRKIPFISGLEFVREAYISPESSQFTRDGTRLIPSVSRVFGYSNPTMRAYYEIYNRPEFSGDYLVYYDISQEDKLCLSDTALFPSKGAVTGRVEEFNVESLLPGIYALSLRIESPGGKLDIKTVEPFIIEWSVLGIVKNDFKTAVEQLRYVATRDEMEGLKKAPENKRIEMWEAFWKTKDPSPGTPENELKGEYYQRVRYADLNFGHFGRDGWKTDMGMVYITYGSPDEIERHPFDIDSKPYQIWYYYEQKRRFVFVDFNGYGEYELQYPYDGDIRRAR